MKPSITSRLFPGQQMGKYGPPWVTPPEGFLPIDRNRATVVVGGTSNLRLERIELTVGYEGWIVAMGIFASSYTTFNFAIRQGNQPLRDYTVITQPLGQPDLLGPALIKIEPNQPLDLIANNTGAGVVGVRYRLFGWYYPARIQGGSPR